MLRRTGLVAGVTVAVVVALGSTASAADTVDPAVRVVERAAGVDVPEVRGDQVAPAPATVRSAVVGYVRIAKTGGLATTYATFGALADPNQWSCSGGGGTTSYTVTCTPVVLPINVRYTCDVLHADIAATSVGSSGKTAMDCNSDGVPEAQTGQKFGPGGYDFVWAVSNISVSRFTCTLDLAVPDVTAGCGDPGTVGVE